MDATIRGVDDELRRAWWASLRRTSNKGAELPSSVLVSHQTNMRECHEVSIEIVVDGCKVSYEKICQRLLGGSAKSNHLVQSQTTAWAQSFREKSNQSGKVNPKRSKPNGHTTIGHVFRSSSIYTKVRAHCRILAILIDLNIPFCADHIGTSTLTNKICANYKVRFLKEDKHVKLLLRPKRLQNISHVQGFIWRAITSLNGTAWWK